MHIHPELFVIVPAVVFLAYVIYGVSGFGSAVINVSLLANFLPLTVVVPISLLLDFSASMMVGFRFRSDVQWQELRMLMPLAATGIAAGVFLLVNVPRDYALLTLGVLVSGYGLYSIWRPQRRGTVSRLWGVPTALFGGALSGMFGTGGPVFVIYISRRVLEPLQLKATLAGIISFQSATRVVAYTISGLLLQKEVVLGALLMSPVMWLGLRLGNRLHAALPRARVMQVVAVMLLASGVALVVRSLP